MRGTRGFSQTGLESQERARNAAIVRSEVNKAVSRVEHKKVLSELIAAVEAVMDKPVIAGGRAGRVTGVDRRTGSPLITFRGSRREEKFSFDSLQFL